MGEIGIKVAIGKRKRPKPFREWFDRTVADFGLVLLLVGVSPIDCHTGLPFHPVLRWSAVFTLALASFLAGVCLVPCYPMWLFGGPLLVLVALAVYALRHASAEPSAALAPGRT